jgi:hypothetical protein
MFITSRRVKKERKREEERECVCVCVCVGSIYIHFMTMLTVPECVEYKKKQNEKFFI